MAKELVARKEVPQELTWDLSLIYPDEEAMYADAKAVEEMCGHIVETYKGKLNTPENILACMDEYRKLYEKATLVGSYADSQCRLIITTTIIRNAMVKSDVCCPRPSADSASLRVRLRNRSHPCLRRQSTRQRSAGGT